LIWNFFATGHGKGEVDKVGALVKHEVRKKQIKPTRRKIQNAIRVVAVLRSKANKYHVVYPNVRHHINEFFHEVKVGDIHRTRPWDCSTVKGSCSKHQVQSLSSKDPTLCQYHQLSYFCVSCMDGDLNSECVKKKHILEWTLTRFRAKNTSEVKDMM
jgi:hypothetical protein